MACEKKSDGLGNKRLPEITSPELFEEMDTALSFSLPEDECSAFKTFFGCDSPPPAKKRKISKKLLETDRLSANSLELETVTEGIQSTCSYKVRNSTPMDLFTGVRFGSESIDNISSFEIGNGDQEMNTNENYFIKDTLNTDNSFQFDIHQNKSLISKVENLNSPLVRTFNTELANFEELDDQLEFVRKEYDLDTINVDYLDYDNIYEELEKILNDSPVTEDNCISTAISANTLQKYSEQNCITSCKIEDKDIYFTACDSTTSLQRTHSHCLSEELIYTSCVDSENSELVKSRKSDESPKDKVSNKVKDFLFSTASILSKPLSNNAPHSAKAQKGIICSQKTLDVNHVNVYPDSTMSNVKPIMHEKWINKPTNPRHVFTTLRENDYLTPRKHGNINARNGILRCKKILSFKKSHNSSDSTEETNLSTFGNCEGETIKNRIDKDKKISNFLKTAAIIKEVPKTVLKTLRSRVIFK